MDLLSLCPVVLLSVCPALMLSFSLFGQSCFTLFSFFELFFLSLFLLFSLSSLLSSHFIIHLIHSSNSLSRAYNFTPKLHDCLRRVSGYENFVKERFERCLDLYLCPRKMKRRLNIDPETLVPRLPKPSELRPYPNSLCIQYLGTSFFSLFFVVVFLLLLFFYYLFF